MQYIKIILSKYKRLSLNHIDYLEINPENKIQLVLGSNGSGKSSVLSQLTPLPANPQDYHKGGYKLVEILHNNSHYVLKSTFEVTGNQFSFVKDGQELNDGFTTTTFTDHVRREFKITKDIQEMLSGSMLFHEMSVAERRNWFTKISDSDYTYAIQYYNRLAERHRDMTGAVKIQQSRLVQESEKLLTPELEEKYRFELSLLNGMLNNLLEIKGPVKVSRDASLQEISKLEEQMHSLVTTFKSLYSVFSNKEGFASIVDIETASVDAKARVQYLESEIQNLCETIEQQDKVLQTIKSSSLTSIKDIDTSIDTLTDEIANLTRQNRLKLEFTDPNKAFQALSSITEKLLYISDQLAENSDRRFSRDNYVATVERSKLIDRDLLEATARLLELNVKKKELEHYKEHNRLECPQCNHVWHKGYNEAEYQLTVKLINELTEKEQYFKKQQEEINTSLEEIRTYLECYREYLNVSKAWTDLQPFWSYVVESSIIFSDPRKIATLVETLKGDLQVDIKKEVLSKQLNEALSLKQTLHNSQESSVAAFLQNSDELHGKLHRLNANLQNTRQSVQRLNQCRETIKQINNVVTQLEATVEHRLSKTDELIEAAKMQSLNDAIQLVQMELLDREQLISKMDMQRAIVMNIQLQISEFSEKASLLKIAIDELSPKQGLIAKGLTGFINHFVAQMNSFIKKIWLYPMELVAITPDIEDGIELDYKFSIRINDDDNNIVPDIAKGSAGMREIFDLAFKVVNMSYLGLEKAPLVLDEFGARLDSAHRQSTQVGISNLINSSNFAQVFMVSHYESAYGSLKNADVCVLHPANINLPSNISYNKHVKIA